MDANAMTRCDGCTKEARGTCNVCHMGLYCSAACYERMHSRTCGGIMTQTAERAGFARFKTYYVNWAAARHAKDAAAATLAQAAAGAEQLWRVMPADVRRWWQSDGHHH